MKIPAIIWAPMILIAFIANLWIGIAVVLFVGIVVIPANEKEKKLSRSTPPARS